MRPVLALISILLTAACAGADTQLPFEVTPVASLREPWAMAFLPDGRLLVTEKPGRLQIVDVNDGSMVRVSEVPNVDYGGQGGLGDVAVHPDFASNGFIYLSYVEEGSNGTRGAAVARTVLGADQRGRPVLRDTQVIWRQYPKVVGRGHFGHRLVFDADGYLWISSGDRQKFTPAQDMQASLGKVLRLHDDGTVPSDNPFVNYAEEQPLVDDEGVYGQIWSLGHRNPLGLAFDGDGVLWEVEMGPAGGDELNRIRRGANYGYPEVSNGRHYSGRPIPDHDTRPEFAAPAAWWSPVISPGDLMVYTGDMFPQWRGNAFVAGLSSRALVRVALDGDQAQEVERYEMGRRIRSVEQGPDGSMWLLEDGAAGRLLKLTPAKAQRE